ncbi:rhomboid protease ROM10, putative [Plasmodium ovale wallikeri]|uniref:Rhomboid protease ROM10, putative n=1 Tax=Plasmodium ovale wallikeri TaxID=864142 RepID=A0A1A8Z528_PLAOA|nr:rhomboid protease ROM10, putative [Plasmodium ovale wallikeri]
MRFLSNAANSLGSNQPNDSKLLISRYARSFNKTFKKDIRFIQILFPSFKFYCLTFFFSVFLFVAFLWLDAFHFDDQNPLFVKEDVLKRFGLNRLYISNYHHYYNYGKTQYIIIMLLSTLCGNLLTCITSGCNDVEMGISAILSGFMGLFLQDIVTNYKNLEDKWGAFASYTFAILSLYLTISMFPYNGNVIGNIGGIFGGFSYPYIFKKASFSGEEKTLKIAFSVVTILLLVSTLAGVLFLKC